MKMKQVVRIGRLYLESVNMDIHMIVLDSNEKNNLVHGVEITLLPKQVLELMESLEKHVSRLVTEKACATCVNYDYGCTLPKTQENECYHNAKKLYNPIIIKA
ncbi:MAG: hypothetical protein ACKD6O_08245 [Candidatus Bathyarchaeota archaeon]